MTTTYRVNVYREDRWWMIDVPELDGHRGADGAINVGSLTQARHYADIEQEARDFICTVVDAAPSAVALDMHIDVDGLDVGDAATAIATDRTAAKAAEERAISRSTDVARRLSAAGVPMREIADIVGVTHQRVDQLIKGRPAAAAKHGARPYVTVAEKTGGYKVVSGRVGNVKKGTRGVIVGDTAAAAAARAKRA